MHLVPAADRSDDLAAAIDTLHTPARRWKLQMPGLVNAGACAAVLEYVEPAPADAAGAVQRDLAHFGDAVDRGGSFALSGDRLTFTGGDAVGPIRYWYCMRRRADFSHDQFLVRYRDVHSQFGLATTGIEGYTQWHADLEASAAVGERLGLGTCGYDSISVLEIADLETFFTAAMSTDVGERAIADEELFVDRANSHDHVLNLVSDLHRSL